MKEILILFYLDGYDENGDWIIVEIDESKFGKRKNHHGHHVEGIQVLGGIERTNTYKTFLAIVPRHDAQTLTEVICQFIRPGSLIYSDMWRAYNGLPDKEGMNWVHEVVNHSIEFVTNEGVHTNTIEGIDFNNNSIFLY